jgi:uncharacterized membrane protein
MSDQSQSEKIPIPRLMLGLGFMLIFIAVGLGAATSKAGDLPKYLAVVAVVAIAVGGIWGALQGRLNRGN